jgi:hypothetical protein
MKKRRIILDAPMYLLLESTLPTIIFPVVNKKGFKFVKYVNRGRMWISTPDEVYLYERKQ